MDYQWVKILRTIAGGANVNLHYRRIHHYLNDSGLHQRTIEQPLWLFWRTMCNGIGLLYMWVTISTIWHHSSGQHGGILHSGILHSDSCILHCVQSYTVRGPFCVHCKKNYSQSKILAPLLMLLTNIRCAKNFWQICGTRKPRQPNLSTTMI